MAILDLQGMKATSDGVKYGKSGSSKNCNNVGGGSGGGHISGLSLLLC
ncbi:MAG: Lanthionine-containing peptide SapB precursor RamS [Solirubrobacteraceae bacterium]|jgi:hypothetical protein|nr:Lanthionine-containing peptide SapB precursor RamS [Solirubrobacteraceae bacterium]